MDEPSGQLARDILAGLEEAGIRLTRHNCYCRTMELVFENEAIAQQACDHLSCVPGVLTVESVSYANTDRVCVYVELKEDVFEAPWWAARMGYPV
jgi:hypothetical protein